MKAISRQRTLYQMAGTCSALAAVLSAGVSAQEMAPRGQLEEVIVTAERRVANVQEVPVAISTFSQDALDSKGITDLDSIQQSVPSLQFTTTGNFSAGPVVTLRGVGTDAVITGADPGVALHVDGVYMGRGSAGLLSFYDLERLEVLRGPQGTLYGRNATGGSINLITQKPQDEFEAFADVQVGNFNSRRVRGVVGGAIADSVAGRLTASWEQRDGYIENLAPGGADVNDADDFSVRGQLRFDLSDSIEVITAVYAAETAGIGATTRRATTPDRIGVGLIQPPAFAGSNIGIPNFQDAYAPALPLPDSLHQLRADARQSLEQDATGASVAVSWDLGAVTVKSLSGWASNKTDMLRDGDGTELPLYTKRRVEDATQFSQELTISSNDAGALEWIVGAFYFQDESDDSDTEIRLPPNPNVTGGTGSLFTFDSTVESTSYALFGQASYYFTDKIRGTVGLRYSVDEKEGITRLRDSFDLTNGLRTIGFPQMGSYGDSWEEPTGKLGLDYFIAEESMLYLSVSRGYKAGGVNINAPDEPAFGPEEIIAWEVGSKNRFFDNSVQLNAALFHYEYSDLQMFSVDATAPLIQNAAESEITGFEVEASARPTQDLTLDFSVSYLDTEILEFFTADPADGLLGQVVEDLSGNRLPRAPEWELNIGAAYDWIVPGGVLTLAGDYHWQDETFFRAQNDADKRQDAFGILNARLTYMTDDGRWRVSAFGNNLSDEEAITNLLIEAGFLGAPTLVVPNNPRTYGIEVGYRF